MAISLAKKVTVVILTAIASTLLFHNIYLTSTTPKKIEDSYKEGFELGFKFGEQNVINQFGDQVNIMKDSISQAPINNQYQEALRVMEATHNKQYNPNHKPFNSK